jgi:transposase
MVKKYVVELEAAERTQLEGMINRGQAAARKILHARILLKADSRAGGPGWKDEQIADAFGVAVRTVELIRKRLVEEGLEEALNRRQRASGISRRKLDGRAEAKLIALACSAPPAGRNRWTVRLLADQLVRLEIVESIGRETVRTTLKKTRLSRG